ncbi:uncharacterized protein LOC132871638 isoform X3 [Neoarius graeffei]|uniref:uncharacterized protein LOC132871638 isoform X3 n=1 Tax=Neoarius graeffei TaxID=443677 RepID=UPI00298D10DB|nr:uncharacterized protein LOC132871638 isoform X3 [Neoarius graeffei]XP_060761955.1 uncharacterized protein LOC132871638 isoform X3 [Neoarius graeffei]XP_060761956.1 uncharacterized protein LOC132871638 isoform X3 [Neoarius graeffei]XP_060761957.1 uncharacterized protein LOC132871638 isoform X3 [Neoarius graeffei]XP_060761958.1 uncharacterized protein LOC132871638 isoform X3 [Neoarius graeffei]
MEEGVREVEVVRKALRAEMQEEKDALDAARAEQAMQEAARLRQHQQQLQEQSVLLAEGNEEEPECMAVTTSSSVGTEFASDVLWSTPMNVEDSSNTSDSYIEENDPQSSLKDFLQHWALKHQITHSALDDLLVGLKVNGHTELPSTASSHLQMLEYKITNRKTNIFFLKTSASSRALHDGQGISAIAAMFERITEAHMSCLMRRIEARFDKIESLVETNALTHTPQLQQDVVLAKPCSTVMELLELDRSLGQPDKRNKMQHFLETVGGAGLGAAIHRMLRRVANNEVLAQYSLRGRRAKMSFDDLILCKIIKAACVKISQPYGS